MCVLKDMECACQQSEVWAFWLPLQRPCGWSSALAHEEDPPLAPILWAQGPGSVFCL